MVATPRARPFAEATGVEHRSIVRSVAGGLNYHVVLEVEMIAQREELVLAGVAGRVLPFGA